MNSKNDNKLLVKLRDIRRAKGMSLHSLSNKIGVDHQRIGRMERGETQMTIDMLYKIADALQTPLAKLLDETTNDDNSSVKTPSLEKKQDSIYLIPLIYKELETFSKQYNIDLDNILKVEFATIIFQCIQDIRVRSENDSQASQMLFQAFSLIIEKLLKSK